MKLTDVKIGDHLLHDTDPRLSGLVVGVDDVGLPRPVGSCVWLKIAGREAWLRVGADEIGDYTRRNP